MRAGRLRHRVKIEKPREVRPGGGKVELKFRELFETWGEINILSGIERTNAAQVAAEATTKIRIRWRAGVDATCRVRDVATDTLYDILAPLPDYTGRRELVLLCVQRTAEGFRRGE